MVVSLATFCRPFLSTLGRPFNVDLSTSFSAPLNGVSLTFLNDVYLRHLSASFWRHLTTSSTIYNGLATLAVVRYTFFHIYLHTAFCCSIRLVVCCCCTSADFKTFTVHDNNNLQAGRRAHHDKDVSLVVELVEGGVPELGHELRLGDDPFRSTIRFGDDLFGHLDGVDGPHGVD
jgi:hypothetical protein